MPFYQGKKEYGEQYIGEPTTWTTKITKEAEAGDILMSVRAPVGPVNFATRITSYNVCYTKLLRWAAPKITNGGGALKIDHNALTDDDLTDFVNNKLFPYLKKFKLSAESADTIEYKIGEIFSELKNRIQSVV